MIVYKHIYKIYKQATFIKLLKIQAMKAWLDYLLMSLGPN